MRDMALMVFVFSMLPIAFRQPFVGLLIWSWLGYMNPHRLTWSYAYFFPFVYYVALVTLVGVIVGRHTKLRIPWNGTTFLWLMFIIWTAITTEFADNPGAAKWEWIRFMKIQAMVAVTFITIDDRRKLHWLIWVIVVSVGFWGVKGGIFTIRTGGYYNVYGPPWSFISDNNTFGLAMIMTFPLLRYLQLNTESRIIRWGLLSAMVFFVVAILGTYSRGGFIGGTVLAIVFWVKGRRKVMVLVTMAILLPIVFDFMPVQWKTRMETIMHYQSEGAASGRLNAWGFAWNLASDRPVLGAGFQAFSRRLFRKYAPNPDRVNDAHSIYFEVLAEQGFVGFFFWFFMYWGAMRNGKWIARNVAGHADLDWARDMAAMVQVGLIGYASAGVFLGLAYFDLPYQYVAIIIMTRVVVERELARKAEAGELEAPRPPAPSIFGGGLVTAPQGVYGNRSRRLS